MYFIVFRSLTETGEKTYQDSLQWQSKHWLSPTQSNGHRDMMEPLKILTNEFAENLGLGSNHKGVDSGYISPSNGILPTTPVKPFFEHQHPPMPPTTSTAPDQTRVDPLLLQQFLQQQPKNFPQQQLVRGFIFIAVQFYFIRPEMKLAPSFEIT